MNFQLFQNAEKWLQQQVNVCTNHDYNGINPWNLLEVGFEGKDSELSGTEATTVAVGSGTLVHGAVFIWVNVPNCQDIVHNRVSEIKSSWFKLYVFCTFYNSNKYVKYVEGVKTELEKGNILTWNFKRLVTVNHAIVLHYTMLDFIVVVAKDQWFSDPHQWRA